MERPPRPAPLRAMLAAPHEDAATRAAFATLAQLYPRADLRPIRAHARRDVLRAANRATRTFCAALADVDAALAHTQHETHAALDACRATLTELAAAEDAARPVLDHAAALDLQMYVHRSHSAHAHTHEELARRLLMRMTLSPEEAAAVAAPAADAGVDASLLAAIDKLHAILGDALLLIDAADLGEAPDAAGHIPERALATHDIRARAAAHLDAAYRRVAAYASSALRRLPIEGADAPEALRAALARLARREDLFRGVLAAFAETRAALLPDAFVHALTVGGPAPHFLPRPIEMHAHDAPRYVSDMLAWVHQLLAGERELVAALLAQLAPPADADGAPGTPRVRTHRRRIGERHAGLDTSVDLRGAGPLLRPGHTALDGAVLDALVRSVLERNVAGCCRPLQTRVLHTLHAQTDVLVVLQLYFLLRFYHATMQQTIGARAALSTTLRELVSTAEDTFLRALHTHAETHLAPLAALPDADALARVRDAARLLRAMLVECAQARDADASAAADVDALETHIGTRLVAPLQQRIAEHAARAHTPRDTDGWSRYLPWGAPARPTHPCDTPRWHADLFYVCAATPLWVRRRPLTQHALRPYDRAPDMRAAPVHMQLCDALVRLAETHVR